MWIGFAAIGAVGLGNMAFGQSWSHSDSGFVFGMFCGAFIMALEE
jgi:hypothetical protein